MANQTQSPESQSQVIDATQGEPKAAANAGGAALEERLGRCTAELEAARREIDDLTYTVAHDLRAPLRLIHAHVQMLREYRGPPDAREPQIHLDQIQRGAQQMSALIDGLLDLSRLAQVELHCELTPLGDLVQQAIAELEPLRAGRDVQWRIGELPAVNCDRTLMLRVLVSLIGNALKYTRPRVRPVIEIGAGGLGTQAQALGGCDELQQCVFVRDNGVGFDMRYVGKLFGAFQRLHRQDEFEGAGVGLAVASRIIQRHGGRIWAEAGVGEGAVFWFALGKCDHQERSG
ncbi:MAG TPA: ATP-binding protein [Steroidobacter sp.]|nr:ATP-binding protein [Steroidobacteraceae bacterium]HLS81685.1 ATP-binding protein [Steroidobacter sp.]